LIEISSHRSIVSFSKENREMKSELPIMGLFELPIMGCFLVKELKKAVGANQESRIT